MAHRTSASWQSLVLVLGVSSLPFAGAQPLFDTGIRDDVDTVQIEAVGERYVPRQSTTPGGAPRHTSNYELSVVWGPGEDVAREDWVLTTLYPVQNTLTFSLTYRGLVGVKEGQDSFAAEGGAQLGAARIGANLKDLWLTNPTLLAAYAESLPATQFSMGGKAYERVTLFAHDTEWTMVVDRGTGLPVELNSIEADPHMGHLHNRVVFSDWREVSGVQFPFRLEQFIGDKLLRREIRTSIVVNPRNAERRFAMPVSSASAADEGMREFGWRQSHRFLARAGLGGPSDTPAIGNVTFHEVGPDIFQVRGSRHHNLLVVGPDGLAIVDAPWYPERSETTLRLMQERWPDRPLKLVILSHHHIDHTGGFRPYAEAGATVVTSRSNAEYFTGALEHAGLESTRIMAVGSRAVLNDIGRPIEIYAIPNSHSDGAIAVYVPDTKLLFNTDLYSPGRPLQFELWMSELMQAVRFYGIDVERHVGGHGEGYLPPPADH